eukprot:439107_1
MGISASASLEHLDERFPLYRKRHQKSFNEICELVVFGFIRNLETNEFLWCMLIPTSITNIILHFFPPIPSFRWNKTIKGNNMIIVNETTIETASESDWKNIKIHNLSCSGFVDNNAVNIGFKDGDKIKLKINFIEKNCRLYYNDIFVGIVYKNIPLQPMVVAASLHQGKLRVCQWNAGFI